MNKLKPCPFCGSESVYMEVKKVLFGFNGRDQRIERHTFSVRCNKCHARGGTSGGKVIPFWYSNTNPLTGEPYDERGEFKLPKWATTDHCLREKAEEAWNMRVNDG